MNTTKQHLIESLRALCEREGGRAAVARAIGSSEKTLWQITNGTKLPSGKLRGVGAHMQERLDEKFPGWHELWSQKQEGGQPAIYIPLLANAASMGTGEEVLAGDVIAGRLPLSPEWVRAHASAQAVRHLSFIHARGDSMSPTFEDGDILLVDASQRDANSSDGIYVLRADGRMFVKRVRHNIRGGMEISSDNPAVKTVDVLDGSEEVETVGRVIWVWNGRKV